MNERNTAFNVSLVKVNQDHVNLFKRINDEILPIQYNDNFYSELLSSKNTYSFFITLKKAQFQDNEASVADQANFVGILHYKIDNNIDQNYKKDQNTFEFPNFIIHLKSETIDKLQTDTMTKLDTLGPNQPQYSNFSIKHKPYGKDMTEVENVFVIGCVCFTVHLSFVYLNIFGLLSSFRRHSIGSRIYSEMESVFKTETKLKLICLHTHTSNLAAKSFYFKQNFKVDMTIEDYYEDIEPASAYFMFKDLYN